MMNIREFGKELWRYRGKSFGLTQEQTYIFVKAFRDLLIDKVCREGEVRINKLGTFYVYETKERLAYDFHKKETFTIPPHKKIAFKPSSYIDGQANFIADGNWENAYRQQGPKKRKNVGPPTDDKGREYLNTDNFSDMDFMKVMAKK